MKLWTVTFETAIAVVADTRDAAREVAGSAMRDMDPSDFSAFVSRVHPGKQSLVDWGPEALVYGTDEDITLAEAERRNGEDEA